MSLFTGPTDTVKATRQCTQHERIQHMKAECTKQDRGPIADMVLLEPAQSILVDHTHKITLCTTSKAAGTALKIFIMENNGLNITRRHDRTESFARLKERIHSPGTLNRFGIKLMHQLDKESQKAVVASYFNMMSIRHPFDRLESYYRDKIFDADPSSNHPAKTAQILRDSRPELFRNNSTLTAMERPQDEIGVPSFREVLVWIFNNKATDDHFSFIWESCHPCAHEWSAILRVETLETDSRTLAKVINSSKTAIPVRHSHQKHLAYSDFSKTLDGFAGVDDEVISYFLDFFSTDMSMFGYRWDKKSRTAYCSIDTPHGPCC